MRSFFLALLWGCLGWETWAAPKTPITRDQELAQQATTLEQQANQETNATRAHELRQEACRTWELVYEASPKPEYQLAVGLCKRELPDPIGAEVALRVFLAQAPKTHPSYGLAQETADRMEAQRKADAEATPQALTVSEPLPTQDSPKQWKRKVWLTGGVLVALGVIAEGLILGANALKERQSEIPLGEGGVAEVVP